MEVDHPPECPDATDLICGLVQELSALKSGSLFCYLPSTLFLIF